VTAGHGLTRIERRYPEDGETTVAPELEGDILPTDRRVLPDVTVLIPTLGRDLLRGCLQSIAAGDRWPAELLVVDQGRGTGVGGHVETLRRRGLIVRHVQDGGRGIAAAMNRGVSEARTRWVATTHDDCRVATDWLRRLSETQRRLGDSAVVTGRVLPEVGHEVPSVITSTVPARYTRPLRDRDVLFPANMSASARLWRAVGPMDEDPLLRQASEDNEWAYRALRGGFAIVYEPGAVVVHLAWRDRSALSQVAWNYARAQGAFYGKYLRRADLHLARRAGADLLRGLWWWVRGAVDGDRALAGRGRAGSLGLMEGVLAGLLRGRATVRPADLRRSGVRFGVRSDQNDPGTQEAYHP
jgi:GT2 family glycosyltransferase